MKYFTVVGFYPDQTDPELRSFVERVIARTAQDAIAEAKKEDLSDTVQIVAVFDGHKFNVMFQKPFGTPGDEKVEGTDLSRRHLR